MPEHSRSPVKWLPLQQQPFLFGENIMDEKESLEKWERFKQDEFDCGVCPYSGLTIVACKSWLCDCFEFEDKYGVSQK